MSYDARISFEAVIRDGVTRQAVEEALKPLLDHSETVLRTREDPTASKMVALDSGVLIVSVDDRVSDGFQTNVFIPVVDAIGALAVEPFEATLEDQDTGDADERYYTRLTGPAHLIPEFKSRQARDELQINDIVLPLSARGWPLEDLATRSCMTIAMFPNRGDHKDAVSRVSVDLEGLDLDEARRARIARLSVLLAREIAGESLILHPRPGYGAAERALDGVGKTLGALIAYDKRLNAEPARAPNGSDYSALLDIATAQIMGIHREALARADARAEAGSELEVATEHASAPRG
ncbi:hypothetical protein LJR175_008272 [Variovorax sp. LjRoot175]|uniref:hypothetical protein n=1 Tax=Variovorax sp. LjRoot175 TaxID=3342276 RepID=UPI003ECC320E